MFTRRDGVTVLEDIDTLSTPAIPGLLIKDCVVRDRQKDVNTEFISPGTFIHQNGEHVRGYDVDGTDLFSYACEKPLQDFIVDEERLFALDNDGSAYVFCKDAMVPQVHTIGRRPRGWHVVPKTNIVVVWNLLTATVIDWSSETRKALRNHSSRVTAACGNSNVTVTADAAGRVCIWYVASWTCFHEIRVGEPVEQLEIVDNNVAIRCHHKITVMNVTTGKKDYTIPVRSANMCLTRDGMVVAHGPFVELFHKETSIVKLKHKTSFLFRSMNDRFWSLHNLDLKEIRLAHDCLEWTEECLAWIAHPVFPFQNEWPSNHYMDVLAMSCDEWLPKLKSYSVSMPYAWFEHKPLRMAIWEATLDNDVRLSHNWLFLEKETLAPWYDMCESFVLKRVQDSYEWDPKVVAILDATYMHMPIRHIDIKKWCWFHHGRISVRPVMMDIFENDTLAEFLKTIANETSSPDAIMCVPVLAVGSWLRRGYMTVLMRWMRAYHKAYVVAPTHQMMDIYSMITQHCFDEMDRNNMDVPLSGTGTWKTHVRLTPMHVGRYARHAGTHGFIQSVAIQPDGERTVTWSPTHRAPSTQLEGPFEIWEFATKEGPRTYLECALTLMRENEWSSNTSGRTWPWFRSENGASINRGLEISLYDEYMHILSAEWTNTGGVIKTTSDLTIGENDHVDIRCVSPRWSYIKRNLFHIAPLQLKINSILSLSSEKKYLATHYAEELLSCCQSENFREIMCWKPPEARVTCMISNRKYFIMGFEDGSIREYARVVSFHSCLRTFQKQSEPILSLILMDTRLIAICRSSFSVFSVPSGAFLFSNSTNFQHKGALAAGGGRMWIVEYAGMRPFVTLWDIVEEIQMYTIDASTLESEIRFQNIVTCRGACAFGCLSNVITWQEDRFDTIHKLDIQGDITCMTAVDELLCGGTDEGVLFALNIDEDNLQQWVSPHGYAMTTIEPSPDRNHVVVGTVGGQIIVWDARHNALVHTLSLCKRPIASICFDNMFVSVAYSRKVVCLVFISGQSLLSCHTLQNIMNWSHSWRSRILRDAKNIVIPCAMACFQDSELVDSSVITLVEECTREYNDRLDWCQQKVVEALMKSQHPTALVIIQRLVQFRGRRFVCAICNDEESEDTISFLKTCQHRFHTGCLHELIRKVPEHHDQMQYEYALTVELRCPSCRVPFNEDDVQLDVFLNQ